MLTSYPYTNTIVPTSIVSTVDTIHLQSIHLYPRTLSVCYS